MKRDLRFERVLPVPPERVWRALTEPEAIASWLMENDFKPVVGHQFQFRTKPYPGFDGIVNCKVLAVDEPHRLSYSWSGGPLKETVVTWTLEAVPEGTRLTLDHTGFSGFSGIFTSFILGGGWGSIMRKDLPSVVQSLGSTPGNEISTPERDPS